MKCNKRERKDGKKKEKIDEHRKEKSRRRGLIQLRIRRNANKEMRRMWARGKCCKKGSDEKSVKKDRKEESRRWEKRRQPTPFSPEVACVPSHRFSPDFFGSVGGGWREKSGGREGCRP